MIADNTQDQILHKLSTVESLNSTHLLAELNITYEQLYPELIGLVAINYIQLENVKIIRFVLSKEGENYA